MATTGTVNVTVTSWDTLRFTWTLASQDVALNTSRVSWQLLLVSGSSGSIDSTANKSWSVTVNGVKYSGTNTIGINNNTTKTLASGSTVIAHNTDGSKTFSFSFSQEFGITFSGSSIGTKTGSGTGALTTIPRASQPSCITTPEHTQNVGEFGDEIIIYMNSHSAAFTHTVRYKFGTATGTIATDILRNTSWTLPLSLMDKIPNATSGTGTIYVDTYNGSTKIGTKSCLFTAKVPASVKPTCTLRVLDGTDYIDTYGNLVKGLSTLYVKVTGAAAYSSPIASYRITANGETYTAAEITTDVLRAAGTTKVTATVTDKRGRTSMEVSASFTVLDYTGPAITSLSALRCTQDGTEDEQGEYVKVAFTANITALNNKNSATYKVRYKQSTEASFTEEVIAALENDYQVTGGVYIFAADSSHSFDVEVEAADDIGTYVRATSAPTAFVLMNWGEDGTSMGIGKVAEKPNTLQVALDMEVDKPIALADGGKQVLTLSDAFSTYGAVSGNTPWCRKTAAGVVELRGIVTPASSTNSLSSNTATNMCTLPEGYRPGESLYKICQGDGIDVWLIAVDPDGTVAAARYRSGATRKTPVPNTWMPFHLQFIADQ